MNMQPLPWKGGVFIKQNLMERLRSGAEITSRQQLKLALQLSWPAIMAQLSSIVMQYIDASMVGSLGANQSAAVGLVATTTWLFMEVMIALTTGFTILVAQNLGARDEKNARSIMKQGFVLTIAICLVLAAVAALISGSLPRWLKADQVIWADASAYFLIYALFMPVQQINSISAGMLRASGNMKVPGACMVSMCFLDVVFNALLIFPTGTITLGAFALPGAGLGVLGAALGTALAHTASAIFLLLYLLLRCPELRLRRGEPLHFSLPQIRRSLQISLPITLEMLVTATARIVTTRIVAPLGTIAIAANSFAITVEALCYMPGYGIQSAAATLVGQSIGAKRKALAYRLGRLTVLLGMTVMGIFAVLMYVFAPQMIGILSPDPEVVALGVAVLRIQAFAEPLYAAGLVASGVFQGAGSTLPSTIMNAISMWGVRVPVSALLAPRFGLHGVWIAMASQLSVCGILFLIRLHRKRWLPADMQEE